MTGHIMRKVGYLLAAQSQRYPSKSAISQARRWSIDFSLKNHHSRAWRALLSTIKILLFCYWCRRCVQPLNDVRFDQLLLQYKYERFLLGHKFKSCQYPNFAFSENVYLPTSVRSPMRKRCWPNLYSEGTWNFGKAQHVTQVMCMHVWVCNSCCFS